MQVPPAEPKNKGGRPRKDGLPPGSAADSRNGRNASAKPANPAGIPAEACTYLMQWGFTVLHMARPWGQWYRTAEQCQPAGEALAKCLEKLPPQYAEKFLDIMPVVALGANLIALVAPSIQAEQEAYERAKLAASNPPPNIGGQGATLGGFPSGPIRNGTHGNPAAN